MDDYLTILFCIVMTVAVVYILLVLGLLLYLFIKDIFNL